MIRYRYSLFLLLLLFINTNPAFSQVKTTDSTLLFKTLPAGAEYKAHSLYKWFWGSNYRNLWTVPVTMTALNLDTVYGGLTAYGAQNNGAAKKVYLKDVRGREYMLVSVDNKPGNLLAPIFKNTIVESRVNDAVSISNPFAGITMPALANAAGTHVVPLQYVYVPEQAALNVFNALYGDDLYELMPAVTTPANGMQMTGNLIETSQLLELLDNNPAVGIDRIAYMRERLLDMFVNDWNRGDNKWRWAETITGNRKVYTPVTTTRDAAYTKYNGKLTRLGFMLTDATLIQSFGENLKDVNTFNFREKDLDRRLLNEAGLNEWQMVASALQQALTDSVIETAIQALPKETYAQTGNQLIAGLKARRSHLTEWATTYYNFLAQETEIPATNKNDVFDVQVMADSTVVRVFGVNSQGKKNSAPFYARTFYPSQTKTLRLFGLAGKNSYIVTGNQANGIQLTIISSDTDSLSVAAAFKGRDVVVYGDKEAIKTSATTTVKMVADTAFKSYNYRWYTYDKNGLMPVIFYSNEDRLYVGLEYRRRHYAWGKSPYASLNALNVHYSVMEKAFSTTYKAVFPKLIAKADLSLYANYDDVRWVYFFGLGNNSEFDVDKKLRYYTMRTRQWNLQPALTRSFGESSVTLFGGLNSIKIINDTARFLNKEYNADASLYNWQTFAGGGISYKFKHLDDAITPVKGVYVDATAAGFQNLNKSAGHYFTYSSNAHFYIPLVSKFSLNIRAGAQTVTGNPEIYQYASVGGVVFRGSPRDRFRGRTAFYNNNDLRFISPVHTHIFAGKAGLLAFVDNARVWLPGEQSNTWHTAIGGGFILAPFDLLYADFNFGFYKKEKTLQVRVTFLLP